jgi:carbamoyltransferase
MNYVGISNGFHDAGISVVDSNGNILFAGHSERYSKQKHDAELCSELAIDAAKTLTDECEIHYYERPWMTALRQLRAGQVARRHHLPARLPRTGRLHSATTGR